MQSPLLLLSSYSSCWCVHLVRKQSLLDMSFGKKTIHYCPPVKYFTDRSKAVLLLWIFYGVISVLCLLCLCVRLFICALWSPAGKELTSWLSFVVSNCECHFPIGILGQVWYLIVSIPDLCTLLTLRMSIGLENNPLNWSEKNSLLDMSIW